MSTDPFEYDVALSFASQDRSAAERLSGLLAARNISVLLDEYKPDVPWGGDVLDHFVNLYSRKARYCVVLISRHYPLRSWTKAERASVQQSAFRDPEEYILPVRLDDHPLPGITEAEGARDLRKHSPEDIVQHLEEKLTRARRQEGPPSRSHDLRSGNVPASKGEPDP